LHVGNNQWKLAPAFDVNPFPDKERESKTWLSEDTGPITSVRQLVEQAPRFELSPQETKDVITKVVHAVTQWKDVAMSREVGMQQEELAAFKPAFESSALEEAKEFAR
jgi:serine/threonine-protein kinase HipA